MLTASSGTDFSISMKPSHTKLQWYSRYNITGFQVKYMNLWSRDPCN